MEDNSGTPANAAFCASVRDQYGLTMPVLYDPDGVLPTALGISGGVNSWSIVLAEGAVIKLKKKYASNAAVKAAIEAELGL